MSAALPLDDFAGSRRWVLWRNEMREDDPKKLTKVPYQPSGRKASSTAPETWETRARAEAAVETIDNGQGGGIGIVLGDIGDETMLAGVDLDTCCGEDGTFDPWADAIIERLATYAEISPSGQGAKLFFRVRIADFNAIKDLLNTAKTGRRFKKSGGGDHPPGFLAGLTAGKSADAAVRIARVRDGSAAVRRSKPPHQAGAEPMAVAERSSNARRLRSGGRAGRTASERGTKGPAISVGASDGVMAPNHAPRPKAER